MISNFLFHRVNPRRDPLWDPMDPILFDKCIRFISSNFKVVQFENFAIEGGIDRKGNFASVMFDDGYKDNIEYALPILQKYHCPASFYVVTDCIDNNTPTWTYILDYLFQNTNISSINFDFDFLPQEMRTKELLSQGEKIVFVKALKPFIKKLQSTQRDLVLKKVESVLNDVQLPRIMLSWPDLQQMLNEGYYVGSHTATHNMLGTMNNKDEIKNELTISGNQIQKELGYFPLTISYPVGSYNDITKDYARVAGYQFGLAVNEKRFYPAKEDLFEIPRIQLFNEPWWKTQLRIYNRIEQIKRFIMAKPKSFLILH